MEGETMNVRTPAQEKAYQEYRDACERLANASVAKFKAGIEHGIATGLYAKALGAAVNAGVVTE
jgi:hypothetical protein